ncbi:hypothetical protein DRO56_00920 [Candidatus Bathyarchaeota archaeon]|nr:MAG: ABC transporter permease [Candidatus Bathyarchaeota archaeon]RLI33761.1 MAG: hypothetical protein DRO56_00920 [Candidatus Bathyarchaeota archaeon]
MRGLSLLFAAVKLALRNLSRRKVLTVFMFLSLMVMTTGFLLIVTVSEKITLEVSSYEGSRVLSTGYEAGCPYWCDIVIVPKKGENFIPESVLSEVMRVSGVEWAEPSIGTIPKPDRFSGDWRIRKPNGTILTPTPVMPLIEGIDPQLELLRLHFDLRVIEGRFLEEGERGVVVIGISLARIFNIEVNDTIIIPSTLKNIFGIFSIKRDAEFKVVGIYFTGTAYDSKVLTTTEEAQDLYDLQNRFTCIFVKSRSEGNRTMIIYELNRIPDVRVFIPTERKMLVPVMMGDYVIAVPMKMTTLSPTSVVEVAHAQIFLIAVFVTGAFIASSTSSKLYERRHEIGLLKSIGFKPSFIQLQVVFETLFIGFTAGIIGFLVANSVAFLSQTLTLSWLPPFPLKMGRGWFTLVLVLSCGVSVLSAYIPAVRSSWASPIEAMRGG